LTGAAAVLVATLLWALGRAFIFVGLKHHAPSAFLASALWGTVLLASFTGWGGALNAVAYPRARADWGLRCAWGWSIAVALGGALCLLRVAKSGVLVGLTGVGLGVFAADLALIYRQWTKRNVWRSVVVAWARTPFFVATWALLALGVIAYLASILNQTFNPNDDQLCYFGFVREIVDRGTLSQPFSFRRIQAYGGTSLLDAMQIAIPVPDLHLHMLDNGMALLSVLLLLVGHVKAAPRTSRAVVLLLVLLTLNLPEIRVNITAEMTGAVFFLGLYRTLVWSPVRDRPSLNDAAPVALLAAAACTLRQNFLVPIAVLLTLEFGAPIVRSVRLRPWRIDRGALLRAAVTAGALVALLAPWWALSEEWCRSFLFPVVRGNYNADYGYFKPLEKFEQLRYVWQNVSYCLPVKAVPLFLLAALTAVDRRRSSTLVFFALAAFVGFAVLIPSYPDVDPKNLGRYYFGFTFPALLAIALCVGDSAGRRATGSRAARADRFAGLPLVLLGITLQVYEDRLQMAKEWTDHLNALEPEFQKPTPWTPPTPDPDYARVQDTIPAGAPVVAFVDQVDRFDFRRNRIESLDMIGAMSPRPGMPLFGSADAVAEYLVSLGYHYAIVVHPDSASYLLRRDTWQVQEKAPAEGMEIWRRTARYFLRGFDVLDELRSTRVSLGTTGKMTAIDLTHRAPR
jgi:hypothetical protein